MKNKLFSQIFLSIIHLLLLLFLIFVFYKFIYVILFVLCTLYLNLFNKICSLNIAYWLSLLNQFFSFNITLRTSRGSAYLSKGKCLTPFPTSFIFAYTISSILRISLSMRGHVYLVLVFYL
jgi:hypothetical protein